MKKNNLIASLLTILLFPSYAKSQCNDKLWNYVFTKYQGGNDTVETRLLNTLNKCISIEGMVTRVWKLDDIQDGDYCFDLLLDCGSIDTLNSIIGQNPNSCIGNPTFKPCRKLPYDTIIHCEVICFYPFLIKDNLIREKCKGCPQLPNVPLEKQFVRLTGSFIYEGSHYEIHPVSKIRFKGQAVRKLRIQTNIQMSDNDTALTINREVSIAFGGNWESEPGYEERQIRVEVDTEGYYTVYVRSRHLANGEWVPGERKFYGIANKETGGCEVFCEGIR